MAEKVSSKGACRGLGAVLAQEGKAALAGIKGTQIEGYEREFRSHLDIGLEVLSGQADVGPAIRPVATLLGLDFIPLRWERYDLLISKDRFFEQGVQLFLGMLHEAPFRELAQELNGYDLCLCGKMVFPQQSKRNNEE
ncbi:MAG: substrate-binding domain-containing protein [Desulfobacterales bacterium]|nr:substrate-binding domain-containing protein [Desulfobacterales bacterium]